jgi:hypothetical protein
VQTLAVVQGRDGARLALESFGKTLRRGLDRHLAMDARVEGAIHLAHPTLTERTDDFVRSKFVTCFEWHGCSVSEFSVGKRAARIDGGSGDRPRSHESYRRTSDDAQ